ncbi:MAG: hypothetical protein IPM82_09545 [Saprospiraceae bacterium]|nr:hypothetical protein [Saprospiraceae bacterium]
MKKDVGNDTQGRWQAGSYSPIFNIPTKGYDVCSQQMKGGNEKRILIK